MFRYFAMLLAIAPALLLAQEPLVTQVAPKAKSTFMTLLPSGGTMKDVIWPRYDKDLNLMAVIKMQAMELVSEDEFAGEKVVIQFFNLDHSLRARAEMKSATLYQSKGLIVSKEPVTLGTDRMVTLGSGFICRIVKADKEKHTADSVQGYIVGPVTTVIRPLPKKP
jgi:hypothetical protein